MMPVPGGVDGIDGMCSGRPIMLLVDELDELVLVLIMLLPFIESLLFNDEGRGG